MEVVVTFIKTKKIINRGFLFGPYCPIYGVGALTLLLILSIYEYDPLNLFIIFAFCASVLEYFTSYLMEKFFNARWWDYSKLKFNLNGRICLTNSIAFGILGVISGYYLNPSIIMLLNYVPNNYIYIIGITTMCLFVIDLCVTFKIVSKLRKNIVLLNKDMTEEINNQIIKFIEKKHIFKAFPLLRQKFNKLAKR